MRRQLQWAAQAESRLFKLECCAIPLTMARGRGIFAVFAAAITVPDLGTQGGEVEVPLTGGPSGTAHHTDSRVVVFIGIVADLEGQTLR